MTNGNHSSQHHRRSAYTGASSQAIPLAANRSYQRASTHDAIGHHTMTCQSYHPARNATLPNTRCHEHAHKTAGQSAFTDNAEYPYHDLSKRLTGACAGRPTGEYVLSPTDWSGRKPVGGERGGLVTSPVRLAC